jgi:hypothetical protein
MLAMPLVLRSFSIDLTFSRNADLTVSRNAEGVRGARSAIRPSAALRARG